MKTVIAFFSRNPDGLGDVRAWTTLQGMEFLVVSEIEELRERLNDLGRRAWVIITDHATVMNLWDPSRSNGVLLVIDELKKLNTTTPRIVLGVSTIDSNREYLARNGCDETCDIALVRPTLEKLQKEAED